MSSLYGMLVALHDNADKEAVRVLVASHGAEVTKEELCRGLWLVKADALVFYELMEDLAALPGVKRVNRETFSTITYYRPTDAYYLEGQKPGFDFFHIEEAWQLVTGSPLVGGVVVDTGADMNHPDLRAMMQLTNNLTISVEEDPTPVHGHGSMTSGIAFAPHNSGGKAAGIAGGCKYISTKVTAILPVSELLEIMQVLLARNPVGGVKQDPWLRTFNLSYAEHWNLTVATWTPEYFTVAGDQRGRVGWRFAIDENGLKTGEFITESYSSGYTTFTVLFDVGVTPWTTNPGRVELAHPEMETLVNDLWDRGYLIFVGAGNSGQKDLNSAHFGTKAIMVGGVTNTGERVSYSSYGPWITVAAPSYGYLTPMATTSIPWDATTTFTGQATAGSKIITHVLGDYVFPQRLFSPLFEVDGPLPFTEEVVVVKAEFEEMDGFDYYYRLTVTQPATATKTFSFTLHRSMVYGEADGTSSSTPFAMGVGLLIWSVNPTFTNAQVKNLLVSSATPLLPELQLGAGAVNALAAVQAAQALDAAPKPYGLQFSNRGGTFTNYSFDLAFTGVSGATAYRIYRNGAAPVNRYPDSSTEFTDTTVAIAGAAPGDEWYVSAVTASGESVLSSPLQVDAPDPPLQANADPLTVIPSVMTATLVGTISAADVGLTSAIATASLTGTLTAGPFTLTPWIGSAELVMPSVTSVDSMAVTPSISAADATGILMASNAAVPPTVTMAELVGVLSIEGISVTASIAEAEATGEATADSVTLAPTLTHAGFSPVLEGSGSIRSPSGQVLDIRDIYGVPLDICAVA